MPGAGLVVVETEFVFGSLEAILNGPALSFDIDQHRNRGTGGAPGGEEGQLAISDIAADQKAPGPQTGQALVVFGGVKIGQFQVGPVEQPRQAEGSSVLAISVAVPATGGLAPQEVNWLVALTPST